MRLEDLADSVLPWRWKSAEEVRSEVEEEIGFHLEERARELEAQGLGPDEARAEARARFGDVQRHKLDCLTVQMGERMLLQKIQWAIIAVLVLALVILGMNYLVTVNRQRALMNELRAESEARHEALLAATEEQKKLAELARAESRGERESVSSRDLVSEPPTPEETTALWRERFAQDAEDWRHGFETARALVGALEPDEAARVLTELWPALSDTHKQQSLKAFAFEHGHPATLAVMHLGATDASLEVQKWAFSYLEDYAFRSFADDYDAYQAWYARWKGAPLSEAVATSAREFVASLHGKSPEALEDELRDFRDLELRVGANLDLDLAAELREAGAIDLIEAWLDSPDEETAERAFAWAASLDPGEPWLRDHLLPCVTEAVTGDDRRASRALRALASPDNDWIVPHVIAYLERVVPLTSDDTPHPGIWSAAEALAQVGDPAVVPTLIGLIDSNPCYDTVYGLGYFGLGKLTGVSYDESHDGAWWVDWWHRNLGRFPAHVRALPIPDYRGR